MRSFDDSYGRRSLVRRISIASLLLLLLLAGGVAYWWYATPSAVLTGQVIAETTHSPLPGAEVAVVGTERSVRADSQGRFTIKLLAAGPIQVRCVTPGYEDSIVTAEMNRGAETHVDIAMASSHQRSAASRATATIATISGQVLDSESGQPLSGVRVAVKGPIAKSTSTASDGRFQFDAIPESKAEIEAELAGYQKTTASWLAGAKPLTMRLSGGATLKGTVVAEAYDRLTPIFGAAVRVAGSDRTTTDRDGSFSVPSLVGGRSVQVEISAEGYASRTFSVTLSGEGQGPYVAVALTGAAVVDGSVSGRMTGKAVANAGVLLQGTHLTTRTGPDGKFEFAAVPPGDHVLHISAEGFSDADRPATVMAKNNRPIDIALTGSKSLRGAVLWEGPPDSATAVSSATVAVKETNLIVNSDAKGRFVLDELPPEPLAVVVKAPGFVPKQVDCDPRTGTDQTIRLRGDSAFSGRVVDSMYDPPRPIPAATIRLNDSPIVSTSNDRGKFAVDGTPSGPARIMVSAPGYLPCDLTQRFERNTPDQLGDVSLEGNSELSGTVVSDGGGRPVAHAELRIPGTSVTAKTDEAGRYNLSGLPPGEFDVQVEAPGYEPLDHHQVVVSGKNIARLSLKKDSIVRVDETSPTREVEKVQDSPSAVVGEQGPEPASPSAPKASPAGISPAKPAPGGPSAGGDRGRIAASDGPGGSGGAGRTNGGGGPSHAGGAGGGNGGGGSGGSGSGSGGGSDEGSGDGSGGGGGGGASGGSGSGGGDAAPALSQPSAEAKTSWDRMSGDQRQKSAVFYIATGKPFSAGRVYMVSISGNILGSVGLRFAPSGMAFHSKTMEDCGLVLAIPRDFGRIMRIDKTGKASTILEKDPALPHPVNVGIPGGSDEIFVADDVANVLARTNVDGRPANVIQHKPPSALAGGSSMYAGASVAATTDKHVILGDADPPSVIRLPSNGKSAAPERCLSKFGGVAADAQSARWAAAQPPNQVCVYQGAKMVKQLSLPKGLVHYGNGLMSFAADDGWLCVACVEKDHPDDGIWLCLCSNIEKAWFERLFQWKAREWTPKDMPDVTFTDKEINSFAVGPWMPWHDAILAGGTMPPVSKP